VPNLGYFLELELELQLSTSIAFYICYTNFGNNKILLFFVMLLVQVSLSFFCVLLNFKSDCRPYNQKNFFSLLLKTCYVVFMLIFMFFAIFRPLDGDIIKLKKAKF
jgi:hypothetical protein